jgi:hypothetical protein
MGATLCEIPWSQGSFRANSIAFQESAVELHGGRHHVLSFPKTAAAAFKCEAKQ